MSSRAYRKRNRPVTACRECCRRKQKCDRLKPCNMCLIRNVPEKCLYGDDMVNLINAARSKEPAEPLTPPSDDEIGEEYNTNTLSAPLEEQIGYSAFSDNAFIDLYKSIDAVHIPTSGSLGLSTVTIRPSLKERYFKIVSHLPAKSICDALIETYLVEADWFFITLDRYFFERLYAAWTASALPDGSSIPLEQYPRDLQHFPALLFQVLAIGLQFSTTNASTLKSLNITTYAAIEKQSQMYSDFGCEIMTTLGRYSSSIAGIEHDIARISWLKNSSRGAEGWHSIGNAVSQAQDLELYLDPDELQRNSPGQETPNQLWYNEYRRRVWARVFVIDSHMAPVLGRPRRIHLDDCTTEWPIDCDVPLDLADKHPQPPGPEDQPSSFTFMIFLIKLALKIHEVMSASFKRASRSNYHRIEQVHSEVQEMLENLPPPMRPLHPQTMWDKQMPHLPKVRQQMLTSANSFLMKLHRPYVHTHEASRDAATRAALGTLDAQQALFDLVATSPNQLRIYGFSFYTIDAGLILSALVLDRYPEDFTLVPHIALSLQQAIQRLDALKQMSRVAASGKPLLVQCYARIASRYPVFASLSGVAENPAVIVTEPQDGIGFMDEHAILAGQDFHMTSLDMLANVLDSDKFFLDSGMSQFQDVFYGAQNAS